MTIGVDIDEVLFPLLPEIIRFHNGRYGTKFELEDFHSYNWWEIFGVPKEEAVEEYHAFWREGRMERIHPLPGAVSAIEKLSEKEEIIAVTLRQLLYEKPTREMLAKYFGDRIKESYFGNSFSTNGKVRSKSEMCRAAGIDLLIDDSLSIAEECSADGVEVLLFGDYKWNQVDRLPAGVRKVRNWRGVLEKINDTRHK